MLARGMARRGRDKSCTSGVSSAPYRKGVRCTNLVISGIRSASWWKPARPESGSCGLPASYGPARTLCRVTFAPSLNCHKAPATHKPRVLFDRSIGQLIRPGSLEGLRPSFCYSGFVTSFGGLYRLGPGFGTPGPSFCYDAPRGVRPFAKGLFDAP